MKAFGLFIIAVVVLGFLAIGPYNNFQKLDEGVTAAWSEVVNQYQRRADLVPNLVSTVKGYAAHEASVLEEVTKARAQVGSIQATPELVNDPAAFAKFEQSQSELRSAIARLLVVSENYPQLKADGAFRDLMVQLEGTENRITVARGRYITTVQGYNVAIRMFPGNLVAMVTGLKPKANFTVENEKAIETAPKVDFAPSLAPPPPLPPSPAPAPEAAPTPAPAPVPAPAPATP
jgi:LemA protein